MRKIIVAGVCAAAAVCMGAGSAGAGEITGNGKPIEVKAKSICAYSGLNDEITEEEPDRTQNWGTIPKEFRTFLVSIGVSPWTECNAKLYPLR